MAFSVWWLAPSIGILLLVIKAVYALIYNVFFHPLKDFPGRLIDRASYIPSALDLIRLDTPRRARRHHQKYGGVVRQSPEVLTFSSAEAWKDIYHRQPGREREFPKDVETYVQGTGSVANIIFAQAADHTRLRRVLGPAFTEKALMSQEDHIQSLTSLYLYGLRQRQGVNSFPTTDGKVDISAWNHFLAYDTATSLTFGESTDCLKMGKTHPWCDYCQGALLHSNWLAAFPSWLPFAIKNLIVPWKTVAAYNRHMELSVKAAKRRISEGVGSSNDYVSYMMRGEDHKTVSNEELIDNINILMPAAAESTAGTIDAVMWYMLHNMEWYHKLVDHIRSEFSNDGEISIQRTSGIKLLQAIINEGMRLHPPIPIALPRVVPSGGRTVAGIFVPENTIVGVHQLACYRSPENFRDPDSYHPERWLGDDQFQNDRRDIFYPFSTGPRNCIAERFAAAQVRLLLTRLLWNFDLELMPGNFDITMQKEVGVWIGTPIWVRVTDARANTQI